MARVVNWLENLPPSSSWRTLFVDDTAIAPQIGAQISIRLSGTMIPSQFHRDVLGMRDHVWDHIPHRVKQSYHKTMFFAVLSKAPLRDKAGAWHRNMPSGNTFEGALRAIYYIATQPGSSIQFANRRGNNVETNGVPMRQNHSCVQQVITVPGTSVFFEDDKCYHRVASNGRSYAPADHQRIFLSFTFLRKDPGQRNTNIGNRRGGPHRRARPLRVHSRAAAAPYLRPPPRHAFHSSVGGLNSMSDLRSCNVGMNINLATSANRYM